MDSRLGPNDPIAPDSFYAVGKTTDEALGAHYATKYGLEVVVIRIGSFLPRPTEPRHGFTWLSHDDGSALLVAAATHPLDSPFLMVFGMSRNRGNVWTPAGWSALDYAPHDDASRWDVAGKEYHWQGGAYAEA